MKMKRKYRQREEKNFEYLEKSIGDITNPEVIVTSQSTPRYPVLEQNFNINEHGRQENLLKESEIDFNLS